MGELHRSSRGITPRVERPMRQSPSHSFERTRQPPLRAGWRVRSSQTLGVAKGEHVVRVAALAAGCLTVVVFAAATWLLVLTLRFAVEGEYALFSGAGPLLRGGVGGSLFSEGIGIFIPAA